MFGDDHPDPASGVPTVSPQPSGFITVERYLEAERRAETRSEYFAGQVFAMTGASRAHNVIVGNLIRELSSQLRGRACEVYPTDMRLRITATGLYTYPDVTVVCGTPAFDDDHMDTLLNPTVLIEVLSASTERYDRGRKAEHYRRIESLREYLLVSQDAPRVEQYTRQGEREWLLTDATGIDATIDLASIECVLEPSAVYDRIF